VNTGSWENTVNMTPRLSTNPFSPNRLDLEETASCTFSGDLLQTIEELFEDHATIQGFSYRDYIPLAAPCIECGKSMYTPNTNINVCVITIEASNNVPRRGTLAWCHQTCGPSRIINTTHNASK
jgi:hypothetical protein